MGVRAARDQDLLPGAGGLTLTLASRSPQRRAILDQLGIEFTIRPADVEEVGEGEPAAVAAENARRKALAVDGELVLGVDTLVALDGRIYGKPGDEEAARAFLGALAGATHQVVSGIALRGPGDGLREAVATTSVSFRPLSDAQIDWYVATGEWRDRAGGYAIQGRGAVLVAGIDGDYLNVVGLPVAALLDIAPELLG
jgi:septum formation protein